MSYQHPRVTEIKARLAKATAKRDETRVTCDACGGSRREGHGENCGRCGGRGDIPAWMLATAERDKRRAQLALAEHAPDDIAWLLDALDDEHIVAEDRKEACDHLSGFAYNGCFTGDCPHDTLEECLKALSELAGEALSFLTTPKESPTESEARIAGRIPTGLRNASEESNDVD